MTTKLGRRSLLAHLLGEPAEAPKAKEGFSLDAFYAKRAEDPDARALPVVELRRGLPEIETTQVGLCPEIEPVVLLEGEVDEIDEDGEAKA